MRADADLALVRRARDQRTAFDQIYDRYADRVYRLGLRHGGSAREAEHLTDRMLERVFGELEHFSGRVPLDAWVYAQCRSVLAERDSTAVMTAPAPSAGV